MFTLCSVFVCGMTDSDRVIPFYSLRLRDLVHPKALLVVRCGACRTEREVPVIPVLARRGPNFSVRDLERVFSCTACSQQGFAMVRVVWF